MRFSIAIVGLNILAACSCSFAADKVALVKDGKPAATIVIAGKASENAKVVDELQKYIEKISEQGWPD